MNTDPLAQTESGTHPDPSTVLESNVLVGATTKNGILCLPARTAALYVPIYPYQVQQITTKDHEDPPHLIGGVTVLGDPICANDCGKVSGDELP